MVRKRVSNDKTTISVEWEVKEELLKHGIGRETDNDILKRLLKIQNKKVQEVIKSPEYKEYVEKLNRPKRSKRK